MYTVIEIQNGVVGENVWSFDDLNQANAKYHSVLAVASVSSVECHTCIIIRKDGLVMDAQCYQHEVVPDKK